MPPPPPNNYGKMDALDKQMLSYVILFIIAICLLIAFIFVELNISTPLSFWGKAETTTTTTKFIVERR